MKRHNKGDVLFCAILRHYDATMLVYKAFTSLATFICTFSGIFPVFSATLSPFYPKWPHYFRLCLFILVMMFTCELFIKSLLNITFLLSSLLNNPHNSGLKLMLNDVQ